MSTQTFRELAIWREAHALSLEIYRVTRSFPVEERHALVSQMRRAASSVPSNIAEGQGRGTTRDFINFLFMARGSAQEVAYFCILTADLELVAEDVACGLENRYHGLSAGIFRCIQSLSRSRPFTHESLKCRV